jgi:beta-galactosidase/beta-glucuronidase
MKYLSSPSHRLAPKRGLWSSLSRLRFSRFVTTACFCTFLFSSARPAEIESSSRSAISLNGDWLFQREGTLTDKWKQVQVPSSFQTHEGMEFHGVGVYRKTIAAFQVPPSKRVLLHFQAAATEADVWLDGKQLGNHLGGWTPFRFDITHLLQEFPADKAHELRVRLDEKVGHNTQGFLPIIAPHFGGLWQDVKLLVVPETYCDDLRLMAIGNPKTGELRLEIPLEGNSPGSITNVGLRFKLRGQEGWGNAIPQIQASTNRDSDPARLLLVQAMIPNAHEWSPLKPNLYEVEIRLPGDAGEIVKTRVAFRSMEAVGEEFRLNGKPLSIRGLLNWGYSPPLNAPNPGEATWRSELEFARSRGFNLMKFCLWIPPTRYLDLADESGMLTWIEYPTWHPSLTQQFLEPLTHEFREFFEYDRNHGSVVLRSLTCETGPAAELKVIKSLYDLAHQMIPGAVVEDDSSWIGWNRINDFYDDHPYGNSHTWVKTLTGLKEHIATHGRKPLALGEAIASDTWMNREQLLVHLQDQRPWWAPGTLDDSGRWLERMRSLAGPEGLDRLKADSLRYGLLARKFQVEVFRREIPQGAYVISVIRDIPNASMGLINYLDEPKWSEADWNWQGDTVCLLKTENDSRSFSSGRLIKAQMLLSHFGANRIENGQFEVSLEDINDKIPPFELQELRDVSQESGMLKSLLELNWHAPKVEHPLHLQIHAKLRSSGGSFESHWPIWIVPAPQSETLRQVKIHESLSRELAQELFPGRPRFDGETNGIIVASRFDEDLINVLEAGGKVLFLPDGQRNSLPLSAHWFLRGAPYIPGFPDNKIPRELLLELQQFDLASDVVPEVPQLDSVTPLLMLWDTHDEKASVKTHGLIFETQAAKGTLLVSAVRHGGKNNAAGRWLLGALLEHLRSANAPARGLSAEAWDYLKARLHAEQTNLVSRTWSFHPDPENKGLTEGWQRPELSAEKDWKHIRIGAWWESQGYPDLDGWAWYRLWVDIPESWSARQVFLSFEGVDDLYELYINGELAGKGGDMATHRDAFNEKKSHNITRLVKPGKKTLIAVRVYDWYGSGGIFRPVTLGTLAFNPSLDFLK